MKHSELEFDVRYAIKHPRANHYVPAYVIGLDWNTKHGYTGDKPKLRGRGRVPLVVMGVGAEAADNEVAARQYTDARHIALEAIVDAIGTDSALDSLLFPADGWQAKVLTEPEMFDMVTWADYEESLETERRELAEKKATYRKLRTHMLRVVRERNALTQLGANAAPDRGKPQKIATPAEVRRDIEKRRALKKEIADLEVKKREAAEVTNYERAVKITEAWIKSHGLPDDGANLAAHQLVLDVSAAIVEEPRAQSARMQHAATTAAKEAMWERWRKGTDGDGYDWLGGEDQDPHHVIDVLLGLLIERGWRPMEFAA
jgi:hypothetical protein